MATAATAVVEYTPVEDLPPKPIKFDCIIFDVACHPTRDMIATADIDGLIAIYTYSQTSKNRSLMLLNHHLKAVRAVRFSKDGDILVSVSKDKSLQVFNVQYGKVRQAFNKAHKAPIYSLLLVDDNIVATGDDDGYLKVWDLRTSAAVMEVHESEETISDMVIESSKRTLVATSGEGTLTAFDIRRHKMTLQSELLDSGLNSMAVVKNGTKVICGSDEGTLNIFNWNEWGNISDRIPGEEENSIDTIVSITEDIICTGGQEGKIIAINILPNRVLGVVGDHENLSVESMCKSHCGRWLVSCGHDQNVRFWDLNDVINEKVDASRKAKKLKTLKPLSSTAKRDDFFSDFAAEDAPETSGQFSVHTGENSEESKEANGQRSENKSKLSSACDSDAVSSESDESESDSDESDDEDVVADVEDVELDEAVSEDAEPESDEDAKLDKADLEDGDGELEGAESDDEGSEPAVEDDESVDAESNDEDGEPVEAESDDKKGKPVEAESDDENHSDGQSDDTDDEAAAS